MKNIIQFLLLKLGYEIRGSQNRSIFGPLLIEKFKDREFTFLQIGANDGVSFDPVFNYVKLLSPKGFLVEPIPEHFVNLKKNYSNRKDLTFINAAIVANSYSSEDFNLFTVNKGKNDWTKGISSFSREHLIQCGIAEENIKKVSVKALRYQDIISEYGIDTIDVVIIDTEGYDYELIKSFPFESFLPSIIHFEHNMSASTGMSKVQFREIADKLKLYGYQVYVDSTDCTAYIHWH